MLRRGRGRPRKQVSCSVATVTSSHKVQLGRVGKVPRRTQLNLQRQRILELAATSLWSIPTDHRRSLRDLKHFARQLGKRAAPPVYPFPQQRVSGVVEGRISSPERGRDQIGWNSSEFGDTATKIGGFDDVLGRKEDESHYDAVVDQWVGVEVLLFGSKSSVGEIGSTTSNVCDKLRSVAADPERDSLQASFSQRRDELREWPSAGNDGVIPPSWVSCRRSITRINASGGISDCHIAALLASLPETGSQTDGQAETTNNISSTEETSLHPCAGDEDEAVIPVDHSSAAMVAMDTMPSAAVIPMEQSFASQEPIVNSGKGSSLDIGLEKPVNISVLPRDAIQVCPTTPEKAQKRRRSYQDVVQSHDDTGMDACEQFPHGRVLIGNSDLRPDNSFKEPGGGVAVMLDFESSCNPAGTGKRGLNVAAAVGCAGPFVESTPTPAMADPLSRLSHVASVIVDPVSQQNLSLVPDTSVLVEESNNRKERRTKSKLKKDSGDIAVIPKVRKKYKPRVFKVKETDKHCASLVENKSNENTGHHGVSKHARFEVIRSEITDDVHRGTSARSSCVSHNSLEYVKTSGNLGEILGSRMGELALRPVTSPSAGETLSLIDNACLTGGVLEGYVPRLHPHGPVSLGHDRNNLLCCTCGLKRRITSGGSETGEMEQTESFCSPSEDQMVSSNSFVERQKHFEAMSVALSNRVLSLLDLPSVGQPHSLSSLAGELEPSNSDVPMCYKESALKEYPQATNEDGLSFFSEEWTAYHAGSAEMIALDAFSEEEMRFNKEEQSAFPEDPLFQSLNAELDEYFSAIADTWVKGSPCVKDLSEKCGLDESGDGGFMQLNPCPSPVQRSLVAQMLSPESFEDRTMSSFYASTSAGVNDVMLCRLNKMIEENVQKDALGTETAEQDLDMDVRRPDCGPTVAPNSRSVQSSAEGRQEVGLFGYYCREEEDLMKMRDTVLCQMRSQLQIPDPDSSAFATKRAVVTAEDNLKGEDLVQMTELQNPDSDYAFARESDDVPAEENLKEEDLVKMRDMVLCQMHSQFQNPDPDSAFATESDVVAPEGSPEIMRSPPSFLTQDAGSDSFVGGETAVVRGGLEDCSQDILSAEIATLNQPCSQKNVSLVKPPFYCMTFVQLVAYIKSTLVNTSEMSPLQLLSHVQDRLPEAERAEFEKLCSMILNPSDSEKLQKLIGLAEIVKPERVQHLQVKGQEDGAKEDLALVKEQGDGAKEDSHLVPCMEMIQYQQIERREEGAKEDNRMTDIVPFVGNAVVVPYVGSFLPLRKRKPRPKVNLDTETIRVWKLLMGKTEPLENDPDMDNELNWKQERLVMQEQAETFIRRMHLIQGDRSFSRWKGSVVDSVIGVFLTQNVSDVLSSSAYMCLRARFPPGRGSVQSNSSEGTAEEMFQNDNPGSCQIMQEPGTSLIHEVTSNCASAALAHGDRQEVLISQKYFHEESNAVGTLPFPGSESPPCLTLQQEESLFYSNLATDKAMNVAACSSELNSHGTTSANENATAADLDMELLLLPGNEDQEPFVSSFGQGEKKLECCVTHSECNFTKGVLISSVESQLTLSTSIQTEVLTGLERARLEAEQVRARKSSKWNSLAEKYNVKRQQAAAEAAASSHAEMTEDGVDWEAVRCADLEDIADAIKERGMNWKLAGRIKGFLERLRLEQGAINLEWLRSIPSDDAKEFLTSVHGLGLKSVECIRLLTLHHLAFPVDTNVGRICVRLGWVPLEPLPEELQLHVLELYPVQATIQKYLWPRLCTLDQQTLYELHYQLITFGKVFCTKSKPNCNACPMRSDCKHFASALASAKLALPPPGKSFGNGAPLALPPGSSLSADTELLARPAQPSMCMSQYCQPIIEEPMTPESEAELSEFDIEDYPFSVEEITHETMMKLVIQEIRGRHEMPQPEKYLNLCCKFKLSTILSEPEIVQEMDMADAPVQPRVVSSMVNSALETVAMVEELGFDCTKLSATTLFNGAPSREVVMLPPEAAYIPVPKLKNIERLRTVHYVYELPDSHPLLEGMDVREADDPCFYLLAIWSPGEVPESIPNINDDNEETGFNFFSDEESIKATLLVPCRTAMQGNFPLNGTYFQVNEVFADHASSLQPLLVPRAFLWNLRRRFVYFGTSVTSILRGMTTEEIQACFWRGYVCVRGFDRMTRAPKPLVRRLHFQTAKAIVKSASVKNTKT